MIAIGTTLSYTAFDEESYSRGLGARFETLSSSVKEVRYKVDCWHQDVGINNILSENKTPGLGEPVKIQVWDGEEGRSYGWVLARKEGNVKEIFYRMKNGDSVYTKDIKEVKAQPTSVQ